MNHAQSTRSKCLRCDFTLIKRRPLILLHEIRGMGCNAIPSLIPLCLVLLLASPANGQLAPEASAVATANDSSSVVVSEHTKVGKEPGKPQPSALGSRVLSEAQALKTRALKEGAQTPLGEHEEALRRELAAARAELDAMQRGARELSAQAHVLADTVAQQAQALNEQQRTDEALALDLEAAQRVIESYRAEASLWNSEKAAALGAHPSMDASQLAAKRTLDDERHKVELLEQELTTARQTIDALKKGANLAAVEQANAIRDRQVAEAALKQDRETLERGRERADSAVRDLDIVRRERDALKQSSADLSAALDQERERAIGLARSLSAAREAIDIVKGKRRTAAVERAPKARTPASALASRLSHSGAQPAREPDLPKKQKVKVQKSPQTALLATIPLPAALLPTRPSKSSSRASED
ncbi:hypothetical protein NKH82_21385 [Mesorhizobium sp. M0915]|uniref:hypothetical protein n=1 Tax=unclassified Mesorhizobium TaxID=325217 RepID=UPI0003F9A41D|nr:hypothetical protein [Mesorhizobium sp. LSHC420B00]